MEQSEEIKPTFDLKLRNAPSDKDFSVRIGKENYNKIKDEVFERDKCVCQGCTYDGNHNKKTIICHVIEINESDILHSPCTTLCMPCHLTQHILIAIDNKYVELINTNFSQYKLIDNQREDMKILERSMKDYNTKYLDVDRYYKKIQDGTISPNSTAKVIFTDEFYKLENNTFRPKA